MMVTFNTLIVYIVVNQTSFHQSGVELGVNGGEGDIVVTSSTELSIQ